MRKFAILSIIVLGTIASARAENTVELVPQTIERGATSDDGLVFSIALNNEKPVTAFQFDIYLPEGMAFDEDPIEFSQERFPHTVGRGGKITWKHSYMYTYNEAGGFYRVIIQSQTLDVISDNSGEVLTIYYVTDDDMPEGILPVHIKNVQLGFSGTESAKPADCSSYLICGDQQLDTASKLDFSALTGTMTADVVAATNEMIADNANLTEVRLDGLDDMGATLTVANPNCMVFMAEGSEALAKGVNGGNAVAVGAGGCSANIINLVDAKPFGISSDITAGTVNYSRDFTVDAWQALYVPYAMSFEHWGALGSVAELKEVRSNGEAEELVWSPVTSGSLEPNTPYIYKPAATGEVVFTSPSCEIKCAAGESVDMSSGTGTQYTLSGTYSTKTDMCTSGAYALYNGDFYRAASDAVTLSPMRVLMTVNRNNAPAKVRNVIDGTTGIEEIEVVTEGNHVYYDLQGRKVNAAAPGFYINNNRVILK